MRSTLDLLPLLSAQKMLILQDALRQGYAYKRQSYEFCRNDYDSTHNVAAWMHNLAATCPEGSSLSSEPKRQRFKSRMHKVAGSQNYIEASLSFVPGDKYSAMRVIKLPQRPPALRCKGTVRRNRARDAFCRSASPKRGCARRFLKSRIWVPVSVMPVITAPAGIVPRITTRAPITRLTSSRAAAPAGIRENERRPSVVAMFSVRRLGERPV